MNNSITSTAKSPKGILRVMKGQSTVEYAVLVVVVIGALLSIQVYVKRGIQGRLKSSSDDIGDQFSPGNTNYAKHTHTSSETEDSFGIGATGGSSIGESKSKLLSDEVTNTSENSAIMNATQEYWGAPTTDTTTTTTTP